MKSFTEILLNQINYIFSIIRNNYSRNNNNVYIHDIGFTNELYQYLLKLFFIKSSILYESKESQYCKYIDSVHKHITIQTSLNNIKFQHIENFITDYNTHLKLRDNVHIQIIPNVYVNVHTCIKTEYQQSITVFNRVIYYSNKYTYKELESCIEKWADDTINKNVMSDTSSLVISRLKHGSNTSNIKVQRLKTFSNVFFEEKQHFLSFIQSYINRCVGYKELGILPKLNILMYGEPGCGKTSIIQAFANYFNLNILLLNITTFYSKSSFYEVISKSKFKLIVLEDFDCQLEQLAKMNNSQPTASQGLNFNSCQEQQYLTIDDILQFLDGTYFNVENRFIFITTNYLDKLDERIYRDGRIDYKIQLKKMNKQMIQEMFSFFFQKTIPSDILNQIEDYKYTGANIYRKYFECNHDSDIFLNLLLSDIS